MGVVTGKSASITNRDATPAVLSNRAFIGAPIYAIFETVEVAAADSDTSKYIMATVPGNAIITGIRVYCDAITAGTSFDLGLYRTTADGAAVIDVDAFASAVDLSSALNGTDIRFESTANAGDIANCQKRVWEMDGLVNTRTTDPNFMYDIVFTANTVGSAAGTISLLIHYTC